VDTDTYVTLTVSDDPESTGLGGHNLVNGSYDFTVTLFKAIDYSGNRQVFTADANGLNSGVYNSTPVLVMPNTTVERYLRILPPGESAAPGTINRKSGSPANFVAGRSTPVTVDLTDRWGNIVNNDQSLYLSCNDPFAPNMPRAISLADGTTSFYVNLYTERTTNPGLNEPTASTCTVILATGPSCTPQFVNIQVDDDSADLRLLMLFPGESLDSGNVARNGKNGMPDGGGESKSFYAGQSIPVTVYAVDDQFNKAESNNVAVTMTSNDPYQTILINAEGMDGNGKIVRNISFRTKYMPNMFPGSGWVAVSTATGYTQNSSTGIFINAGALNKLQILMPGETLVPGSATGKSGSPYVQVAGIPFISTVCAVDQFYNLISTDGATVVVNTKDPFDANPGLVTLNAGMSQGLTLTLNVASDTITGGTHEIYSYGSSLPVGMSTSTAFAVNPNTNPAQISLQVIVPGETAVPGSTAVNGFIGTASTATAGVPFNVSVKMVDSYYNKIPANLGITPMPILRLITEDPYDDEPADLPLVNGTTVFSNIMFQTERISPYPGWRIHVGTAPSSSYVITDKYSSYIINKSTTADRLQLLLPGETVVPGSAPPHAPAARGRSGVPDSDGDNDADGDSEAGLIDKFVAGVPYQVTVRVTDKFYNLKPTVEPQVQVVTTDPYDTHPGNKTLTGGTTTFSIVFKTNTSDPVPTTWSVSASTSAGATNYLLDTVSGIEVLPSTPTQLMVLLPGETAVPGRTDVSGKLGAPGLGGVPGTPFVAGTPFNVTVRLVDPYFNKATSNYSAYVRLSADDPYDFLGNLATQQTVNGEYTFTGSSLTTRDVTTGWTITASTGSGDYYTPGVSTRVYVRAGDPVKLIALVDGENLQQGNQSGGGRTGTPDGDLGTPGIQPFVVGTTYMVRVYATDIAFNLVDTTNPVVSLYTDDIFSSNTLPSPQPLDAGTTVFAMFMVTAENKTTKIGVSNPGYTVGAPYETPALSMQAGIVKKLQILLPGETAVPGSYAGTAKGRRGTPNTFNADSSTVTITVRAVDKYWNLTTAEPAGISMTTTDPWDPAKSVPLTQGVTTYYWKFPTATVGASSWTVTATDGAGGLDDDISRAFLVVPGLPVTLQALVPGETAVPGSSTGKTGSASDWIAGVPSTMTVNVVDAQWNRCTSADVEVLAECLTDPYDSPEFTNKAMASGTNTFPFTLITNTTSANLHAAKSGGATDLSTASVTTINFTVRNSSPTRVQLLVPGETPVPGSSLGKSGFPDADGNNGNGADPFTAGVAFQVTVRAVDNFFNPILDVSSGVYVRTSDPHDSDTVFGSTRSLVGGTTYFNPVFVTAGDWQLSAYPADAPWLISDSTRVTVQAGNVPPGNLLLLLPGETAVPGDVVISGKTGVPDKNGINGDGIQNFTAGEEIWVTVQLTDAYYNPKSNVQPQVYLHTSDPYDSEATGWGSSNPKQLNTGGNTLFKPVFRSAGSWCFSVSDDNYDNLYTDSVSSSFTVVASTPTKLIIHLPGQTYTQGLGITGTPNDWTAGVSTTVYIYATDDGFNRSTTTTQSFIYTYSNDSFAVHPGSFTMTDGMVTISTYALRSGGLIATSMLSARDTDASNPVLTSTTTMPFRVRAGDPERLQLVLPGEMAVPGSSALARGVIGTPTPPQAGVAFPVEIRITDSFWNPTSATSSVRVITTDPNDASTGPWTSDGTDPTELIVLGTTSVSMRLITATSTADGWTFTVTDTDPADPALIAFTSAKVGVEAGNAKKLLTLLPGESEAFGTATGKRNSPTYYAVGQYMNLTVKVTDKFFNTVTIPPAVRFGDVGASTLTTVQVSIVDNTDPYAEVDNATKNVGLVSGQANFQWRLHKAGAHQIRATDMTPSADHSPAFTTSDSTLFTAWHSTASAVVLLMPGETATPGAGFPGKTGVPDSDGNNNADGDVVAGNIDAFVSGTSTTVYVQVVDQFYNPVIVHAAERFHIVTADPYDTHPATPAAITSGLQTFTVPFRTAASYHTVTGYDTNLSSPTVTYTASTSPVTGTYTVLASSASKLQIIVDGETPVPGSATGKVGAPVEQTAGVAFGVTVRLVDEQYNLITLGDQPTVMLTTNDPQTLTFVPSDVAPLMTGAGEQTFFVTPKTATTTFVITAATTTGTPAGLANIRSDHTANIRVWPNEAHYMKFSEYPSSTTAGSPFSARITVYDAYDNICSTGPVGESTRPYQGAIEFLYQSFPNPKQNTYISISSYTFTVSDLGTHLFSNIFTFNKMTVNPLTDHWLEAHDKNNTAVNTEVVGYSTRPVIAVGPSSPAYYLVTPSSNKEVGAGSLTNFGKEAISAQIVDSYDNPVSSAGVTAYASVQSVIGSTGVLKSEIPSGTFNLLGTSTTLTTDANGMVGVNPPLWYFVSTKAGDSGRVWIATFTAPADLQYYTDNKQNITGQLTTKGGTPTNLVFITTPTYATAGNVTTDYEVQRRDDFTNPTGEGQNRVTVKLLDAQNTVHTNKGYVQGTPTVAGDYGFKNEGNTNFLAVLDSLTMNPGVTSLKFKYVDKMSSYPPLEDGRPASGKWEIRAEGGTGSTHLIAATHQLRVDPRATVKAAFDNPMRTLVAATPWDTGFNNQPFRVELEDEFSNPTYATQTVTLALSTERTPAPVNDTVDFSTSPDTAGFPTEFVVSTTTVLISSGAHNTTFYYLDARASSSYEASATTKPVIMAYPLNTAWTTAYQSVVILPAPAQKIVFLSTHQYLVAGATSSVYTFQLRDPYDNPSPINSDLGNSEDSPGQGVIFDLESDSTGTKKFASPDNLEAAYTTSTGTAKMVMGQHTTTFYMIDTMVGNHTVSVDEHSSKGWVVAVQTYTVTPAPPSQLAILTPVRKLIAGTTSSYEGGVSTPVITVELRDAYQNTSWFTTETLLYVTGISAQARGSYDNVTFQPIDSPRTLPLTFSPGPSYSRNNFYYYDTIAGTTTVSIFDPFSVVATTAQPVVITPNRASYFSINHPFPLATPLKVGYYGTVSVTAKDYWGNVADGGQTILWNSLPQNNGLSYVGTALFGHNGSTATVSYLPVEGYKTVAEADKAIFTFQIRDMMQSTLRLSATDQVNTNITGRTTDPGSSADLVTTGLTIVRTSDQSDYAPGSPTRPAGCQSSQGENYIYQGEGASLTYPNPVTMMAISMAVRPLTANTTAHWQTLKVNKLGTLGPAEVVEVALWRDMDMDACFDITADGDGDTVGVPVATTTFNFATPSQAIFDFSSKPQIVNKTDRIYFVTLRISTAAEVGATIGCQVTEAGSIGLNDTFSTAGMAINNFPLTTTMSEIKVKPADVYYSMESIAPTIGGTVTDSIPQGMINVGMAKLQLWTNEFTARVHKLKLQRIGTSTDADIKSIRVYWDEPKNDLYQPNYDVALFNGNVPFVSNEAVVDIAPVTISASSVTFWIAYDINDSAAIGKTVGLRFATQLNTYLTDGLYINPPTPLDTASPLISATTDTMITAPETAAPGGATQGDENVPILKLAMHTGTRTAIWNKLRINRSNVNQVNLPTDVDEAKVWYDINGDNIFDSSVDQRVSPLPIAAEPHIFPRTILNTIVNSGETTLRVQSVDGYPTPPGILVIADNTANREEVTYTGIDTVNKTFTVLRSSPTLVHAVGTTVDGPMDITIQGPLSGQEIYVDASNQSAFKPTTELSVPLGNGPNDDITVEDTTEFPPAGTVVINSTETATYASKTTTQLRGVVRTTPRNHPSGSSVVGPARNKTYYVTFNIDDLAIVGAHVGKQTELGLRIPASGYFTVGTPDIVAQTNLPWTASILDINEFADEVTITPFNPDNTTLEHGDETLQQKATAQVVLGFTMVTDNSEAWWTGIKVRSTGTAVAELDVSTVTIWVDGNRNGFFDPAAGMDVAIGTGTFGNIGETGVAQIIFATAPTLVTAARSAAEGIPSMYFVTYDIASTATPDRMLGCIIKDENDFMVSSPNFVDADTPAFYGKQRQIIPAPQQVRVEFTPLFTNLLGSSTEQSLVAPVLGGDISASQAVIPVINAHMLPPSGYAVIDSEIIYYGSRGPGVLDSVFRGQLNTTMAPHAVNTVVGSQFTQGDKNLAFMKMRLYVDDPTGYNVRWFRLKLNRYQPAGLLGDDRDIQAVKLYRDTGSPGLDRNPATGLVNDILVAQKYFGLDEAAAQATLNINGSLFGGASYYILITTQPVDYIITLDVDPTAVFDRVIGARCASESSLIIGAQAESDGIHTILPFNPAAPGVSPVAVLRATVDTLLVRTVTQISPTIYQNQQNVNVMQLNLRANNNTAVWQKIRLDMATSNGAVDGDVSSINIWKDFNNNGIFDTIDSTESSPGVFPHRMTYNTDKFVGRVSTITLITPEVITSSAAGQNYFVTFNMNPLAQVGKKIGLSIGTSNYITVGTPDLVSYVSVLPSDEGTIGEVSDNVVLGINDIAENINSSGGTYQGSLDVPMLLFSLWTDVSQATFEKLRVERLGTSQLVSQQYGLNSDIAAIKIYLDADFTKTLSAGDQLISSGLDTFNLTDENDTQKLINLTVPQRIGTTATNFFVAYDIGYTCRAQNTVGVKIPDSNSVGVSIPNTVRTYFQDLTDGTTAPFAVNASQIVVNPIKLRIISEDAAPPSAAQETSNVPVLKLKMHTSINTATINNITVKQLGTAENTLVAGNGFGDFSRAAIWQDDGDEVFIAANDTLLGQADHGTANFMGGYATIPLGGTGYSLTTVTKTFFITADIGSADTNGTTVGHTVGFSLEGIEQIDKVPATALNYDENYPYPKTSGLITILKSGLPKVPFIKQYKPVWIDNPNNLDGYPDMDRNNDGTPEQATDTDGNGEPDIDVDEDGKPDNLDLNDDGLKNEIDMDGDNLPDMDINGDGIIDFDLNADGKPDLVLQDLNGDGIPELDLSGDGAVDFGRIPERWNFDTNKLTSRWPSVSSQITQYQVGMGVTPDTTRTDMNSITYKFGNQGWLSTGAKTSFSFNDITIAVVRVTNLAKAIGRLDEPPFDITVESADGFSQQGGSFIYLGSEIMEYSGRDNTKFHITDRAAYGTQAQSHPIGERVTNDGYFFNIRAMDANGQSGPAAPTAVYRVDVSIPESPGKAVSDPEQQKKPAENGIFEIRWDPAADAESGVRDYEIQEREDNNPVWRTVSYVPAARTSYMIGNSKTYLDTPRPKGHFYTYRIRARNFAGGWSEWSPVSNAAYTGLPPETISEVFNYPNPADTRVSPTYVTYILNEDANVTIGLYDLMGYKVREWVYNSGDTGGRMGPNTFPWDGTNEGGGKVAAGGYIMRIEVRGTKGTSTVIRKIGIIH